MEKTIPKSKEKQYDRILDEYIETNLFEDFIDEEKEKIRNFYRVPENEKYQDAGIKAALMLQFEPFFSLIIKVGICTGFAFVMKDLCVALSSKRKLYDFNITDPMTLYSFDVIYMLDVLLMFCYKKATIQRFDYLHSSRHILIVSSELVSIIPLELFYLLNSSQTGTYFDIYCLLRMRYCIRLIRLVVGIVQNITTTSWTKDIAVYILLTVFFVIMSTTVVIIYNCRYHKQSQLLDCDDVKPGDILLQSYLIIGKLVGVVIDEDFASIHLTHWLCLVSIVIFIFFIVSMGRITFYFIQTNLTSYQFTAFHEYVVNFLQNNSTKDYENMSQIDKLLPQTLKKYIDMLFDRHVRINASASQRISQIIPDIVHKEITCDIYWDALKHVELFHEMPADFLRYVSTLALHQFYTEGEPIYTRSENMAKLVFIINGIVNVHSEVNGETPIISFTNGTVLGASTLALSRNSTTYVTCHSFCETIELHRKDFIKACDKYPQYVHDIMVMIKHRCDKAKEYLKMSKFQRQLKIVEESNELLSIRYIKHKLRVLLGKDMDKVNTQQIWSYDDQRILENEDRSIFCSDYIRNYVITKDQDLDPDINFMRRDIYFKFRPECPVLMVWNLMIALMSLITGAILPYFISFEKRFIGLYIVFVISITIIWFLDTILQLVTGVETADHTFNTFVDIFKYRMTSFAFIVDIVACIPFEVFIYFLEGDIPENLVLILQVNRMLKMYRFSRLCNQCRWASIRAQLYIKYFKYIVLFAYASYFTAAILNCCLVIRLREDNKSPYKYFVKCILLALEFIAGVDVHHSRDVVGIGAKLPLVGLQLMVLCTRMYLISDLGSSEALSEMRNSQFLSYCASLKSAIGCFNLDKVSEARLWVNVNLQWNENKAEHILKTQPLKDLSARLHELLKYSAFGHHLHKMELLRDLPDTVIRNLCLKIDIRVVPCNEIVTYAGTNAREMFLILQGFCGMLDCKSQNIEQVLKPGSSISVLEMLHKFRSTCTVIALSDCKMAVFERKKFISEMTRYPEYLDEIMETLWCSVTRADLEEIIALGTGAAKYRVEQKPGRNFYNYKYFLTYGSKAYYHYMYPFPARFHFLKYFICRMTICNHESFIFYYELVRCTCAYLTCFLGSFTTLTNCSGMHFEIVFNLLDAGAWIDIAVRHYICYYDSKHVEVRHPANTIFHYWTHGFLVDLFAVLPFDSFINSSRILENEKPIAVYVWNRCVQLYRPYFFKRHITHKTNNTLIISFLSFLQMIIITVLLNHFVSRFSGIEYQIGGHQFAGEFYKELQNLVDTVSLFLSAGFKSIDSEYNDYINIFLTFTGHLYLTGAMAKSIGFSLFCNVDITTYQGKMNNLVKFLNYRRIDKHIKAEIIKHFEYVWLKRRGMLIHESVETLNTAFKEDMLYAVYGKTVKRSTALPNAPEAFIQNYLLSAKHVTFLDQALIYTVNDVHGLIYFLFKGIIQVLGPDKCPIATLNVGSFFGCLDRCLMARHTLTMVAQGHCEILSINSWEFHNILANFRELKAAFRVKTSAHVDYLDGSAMAAAYKMGSYISNPSYFRHIRRDSIQVESLMVRSRLQWLRKLYDRLTSVTTNRNFNKWWSFTITTFTFICFNLEVYQKVTMEMHVALLVALYLSDAMTLYRIFAKLHMAVEDEYGRFNITESRIVRLYRKDYLGLYFDIFTMIPFELLAIPFVDDKATYLTALRFNRLFKIFICFFYLRRQTNKLNINVYMLRSAMAFLVLFTVQQITTIFMVRNEHLDSIKTNFRRYLRVNSLSIELICSLYVPGQLMRGDCWYMMFIVITLAYLRMCLLYFLSACTSALFMSHHNSFVYWRYTDKLIVFMKRLKISKPLLDRVQAYFQLSWTIQNGVQFPEFLSEAPYYLREAVLVSMFGNHIEAHPLLGRLHVDLVRQMVAQLQTKTFFTGDFIAFVGDIDETMYFLHDGEIVALIDDNLYEETVDRTYGPGQMFGLRQGILRREGHQYTYRATRLTVLLLLHRSHWLYMLDLFPASKNLLFDSFNLQGQDRSLDRFETKHRRLTIHRKSAI